MPTAGMQSADRQLPEQGMGAGDWQGGPENHCITVSDGYNQKLDICVAIYTILPH